MTDVSNVTTTFVTATTGDGESDCTTYERMDYEIGFLILSVIMGLFGLVYTFVGYRCFKAVMFLSGFIFGGTVVYVICQEEKIVTHNLSPNAIIGISIGVAILCGLITMLVVYVGLFLQGFFMGLLIAIGAILALSKFYNPSTPWIPFGILFGTGILFILLTLKWQKTFLILGTSIMGAALICSCLQYFLGKFSLHRYIWVNLMAEQNGSQCWFFPIILGLWPGLALIGIIIQWKFTGKGFDHTDVIIRRNENRIRTHLVRPPQEERQHQGSDQRQRRSRSRRRNDHQRQRSNRPTTEFNRTRETTAPRASGRTQAAATRQTGTRNVSTDQNFDTLPPSYDDCVRRGVGRPVTESDLGRIVRTKEGSYLAPHDNPSFTGNVSSTDAQSTSAGPAPGHTPGGVSNFVPGRRRRRSASGGRRASPSSSNSSAGRRRSGRSRDRSNRSSGRSQASAQQRDRQSGISVGDDRESLLRT